MFIDKIDHIDQLENWYQGIFKDTSTLIPYNNTIHNIVLNNFYFIARNYITNGSNLLDAGDKSTPYLSATLNDHISSHNLTASSSTSTVHIVHMTEQMFDHFSSFYYFPFTRSVLFSTFFSSFLPSLAERVFLFLRDKEFIIQYGPGYGTSFAINNKSILSADINHLQILESINGNFDYAHYKKSSQDFISFIENKDRDYEFIQNQNNILSERVNYLESTVTLLENQLNNFALRTWA